MKATQGTTYRMLGSRLEDVSQKLEEFRKIGATGKKLNAPSDNPAAIRPVLNTRKQLSNVDRYKETMGKSLDTMQATDGYLEHTENIMQRAKEIMTNSINGSLNAEDRNTLADELAMLRKELVDTANGSVDGKYLFAGYEEGTKPFLAKEPYNVSSYDPNDATTWPVAYKGDGNPTSLETSTGEYTQVNLTGNELFFGTTAWPSTAPGGPEFPEAGRYNLFNELTLAEKSLRANDIPTMETSLDNLEGAAEQNRRLRSQLGNRTSQVETSLDNQEGVRIDLKQILSRYEDADAIESLSDIIAQETALKAALEITGKVSQLSILDYI